MSRVIKLPNGEVKPDERINGYVPWKAFVIIMTILFGTIGSFWTMYTFGHSNLAKRVEIMENSYTDIKCQLAQIQSDLVWVRQSLQNRDNK